MPWQGLSVWAAVLLAMQVAEAAAAEAAAAVLLTAEAVRESRVGEECTTRSSVGRFATMAAAKVPDVLASAAS